MQERFGAGAVQRAVLLQHGDDPAIEPGQLLVRVFVEASDEPGLTVWQSAHQEDRRDPARAFAAAARGPAARVHLRPARRAADQRAGRRSLAVEQLSGREM